MQLGILNACSLADEGAFDSLEFVTFQEFFQLTSHNATLVEYRITESEFPASPTACDAFLITGSPKGVYDEEPWITQLGDFIRGVLCCARQTGWHLLWASDIGPCAGWSCGEVGEGLGLGSA